MAGIPVSVAAASMIRVRVRVASASHAFFAVVMVGLGIQGLITRDCGVPWLAVGKR